MSREGTRHSSADGWHRALALVLLLGLAGGLSWPAAADLAEGRLAFERGDYEGARRQWLPLAEQGNAEAQFDMGVLYAHARGEQRNFVLAAEWYERAARQGHREAQFALGFLYYTGAGEGTDALAADFELAALWLERAANAGIAMAQYLVGSMYLSGTGLVPDPPRAFAWTLRAARQGVAGAQFNAGLLYANGRGGPLDLIESYKWFALAAASGYPGARHNLSILTRALSPSEVEEGKSLVKAWRPTPEE